MMWEAPLWLIGVPVALAVLGAGILRRLRSAGRTFDDPESLRRVSVDRGRIRELAGSSRRRGGLLFFWIGVAFLCVALARPQWGWINLPRFEQAREVIIALDLSKSMLAEDVKPSRLARSRLLVENLLDELRGERVGLVLFAGTAFTQSPLSSDYEVLREFLPELEPSYLPQGGTDYTAMIDTSLEAFGGATAGEADRYLIILSDGESLSDDWQSRVESLKEGGVRVIGLGVGTPQGSVIPDPEGGVVKDRNGSVVLTRLNPSTLQGLARRTGGAYRQADVWVDLPALLSETVEAGRKGEFSEQRDRRPIERYQIPLLLTMVFWVLSMWREFPVRPRNLSGKDLKYGHEERSAPTTEPEPAHQAASPPPLPVLLALLLIPAVAVGQSPAPESTVGPAQRLAAEVAQLSQRPSLGTAEYASLATSTIESGKAALQSQQPLPRGAIEDALDAVFYGESEDPEAADWETLRAELEKLLEHSPEESKQEEKPDNKNQKSEDGGQKSENQKSEGGGQPSGEEKPEGGDPQSENQKSDGGGQRSENQDQKSEDGGQKSGEEKSEDTDQSQNSEGSESEPPGSSKPEQRTGENALGEMAEDGEEADSAESEPDEPKPADRKKQEKMQTVRGSKTGGEKTQSDNPQMAAALQRLEKISEGDVPAKLFRALNPDRPTPEKDGKDW